MCSQTYVIGRQTRQKRAEWGQAGQLGKPSSTPIPVYSRPMRTSNYIYQAGWPNGKALDFESRDCRFDPCVGHILFPHAPCHWASRPVITFHPARLHLLGETFGLPTNNFYTAGSIPASVTSFLYILHNFRCIFMHDPNCFVVRRQSDYIIFCYSWKNNKRRK
jgi:hypothetical protein